MYPHYSFSKGISVMKVNDYMFDIHDNLMFCDDYDVEYMKEKLRKFYHKFEELNPEWHMYESNTGIGIYKIINKKYYGIETEVNGAQEINIRGENGEVVKGRGALCGNIMFVQTVTPTQRITNGRAIVNTHCIIGENHERDAKFDMSVNGSKVREKVASKEFKTLYKLLEGEVFPALKQKSFMSRLKKDREGFVHGDRWNDEKVYPDSALRNDYLLEIRSNEKGDRELVEALAKEVSEVEGYTVEVVSDDKFYICKDNPQAYRKTLWDYDEDKETFKCEFPLDMQVTHNWIEDFEAVTAEEFFKIHPENFLIQHCDKIIKTDYDVMFGEIQTDLRGRCGVDGNTNEFRNTLISMFVLPDGEYVRHSRTNVPLEKIPCIVKGGRLYVAGYSYEAQFAKGYMKEILNSPKNNLMGAEYNLFWAMVIDEIPAENLLKYTDKELRDMVNERYSKEMDKLSHQKNLCYAHLGYEEQFQKGCEDESILVYTGHSVKNADKAYKDVRAGILAELRGEEIPKDKETVQEEDFEMDERLSDEHSK